MFKIVLETVFSTLNCFECNRKTLVWQIVGEAFERMNTELLTAIEKCKINCFLLATFEHTNN